MGVLLPISADPENYHDLLLIAFFHFPLVNKKYFIVIPR